jgi:hypothetical protein
MVVSDGDFEMLQWTTAGAGSRFGLIVHHTDADPEYADDRQSHFGKLDKALDECECQRLGRLNMKSDRKKVFAFQA